MGRCRKRKQEIDGEIEMDEEGKRGKEKCYDTKIERHRHRGKET